MQKHILGHTNSPTLPICEIRIGSLTLPAPEAGDFGELILLYSFTVTSLKIADVQVVYLRQNNQTYKASLKPALLVIKP